MNYKSLSKVLQNKRESIFMTTYIGAKLYPKQKEIADKIISTPQKERTVEYHIVNASRQVGKSFMLKQILLYYAINEPQSKNLFVSMTFSQTNKIYNELIKAIEKSGIIAKKNGSEYSLILTNGSEIYFRSYQRCDTIRGTSVNTLIIDESAFVKDEDFNAVLRPTLATAGKRCILFSTPRGHNFFYDMAMKGMSSDYKNYHYYYATYRDNPFANTDEIEDARKTLPEKIFKAEYEAEFISGSMSVFENVRNCIGDTRVSGACCAAIDVGRQNDYTVLTIMSGNMVVLQKSWRLMTWEDIIKAILNELKKFNVRQCHVEVNGLGDPFYEMLLKACKNFRLPVNLLPWTTSNVSKMNAIEQLINDFSNKNIIIQNDSELLFELDNFEAEYSSKSHAIKYAAREPFHDDRVMSLAICNYNRINIPSGNYKITTC